VTALAELRDVPGYTPFDLCLRLATLAGEVQAGLAIVEVGVFRGRTACYLGAGAKAGNGAHVWAVDPWDLPGHRHAYVKQTRSFTSPRIRRAAESAVARHGFGDQVTLVRGFSTEVAAGWDGPPVGLLFVDGDHTAPGIRGDLQAWQPHLAASATVVIDDYHDHFPEVRMVVAELVKAGTLAQPQVWRTSAPGRAATFAVTRFLR
jgi:hypothetical protein